MLICVHAATINTRVGKSLTRLVFWTIHLKIATPSRCRHGHASLPSWAHRNTAVLRLQSITALAHLQCAILYFIDISEQCGYTIAQQVGRM
jgi:hypothetical protein